MNVTIATEDSTLSDDKTVKETLALMVIVINEIRGELKEFREVYNGEVNDS